MRLAKSGYYDEKRAEAKEQTKETQRRAALPQGGKP